MWYWIIKVSILSLVFIFLLHYLYSFFISTLTVPKVKDLVTLPQKKYNEMFDSLQQQQQMPLQRVNSNNENSANTSTQSMKEDLIHFLKDLGSTSGSTSGSGFTSGYPFDSNISSFSFTK
jgi:predicted PurR-regulated permease PerM